LLHGSAYIQSSFRVVMYLVFGADIYLFVDDHLRMTMFVDDG